MIPIEDLKTLLAEVTEGQVPIADVGINDSLTDLGVSSFMLLSFLVAIEDRYGFSWDPETPTEAFASLYTIHSHLAEKGL